MADPELGASGSKRAGSAGGAGGASDTDDFEGFSSFASFGACNRSLFCSTTAVTDRDKYVLCVCCADTQTINQRNRLRRSNLIQNRQTLYRRARRLQRALTLRFLLLPPHFPQRFRRLRPNPLRHRLPPPRRSASAASV